MRPIPTLQQLYTSIKADLESALTVSIPLLGKIFLVAQTGVQAGKLKLFYLALGLVQKNIAPDGADSESDGGTLERFGRIKLNRNPNQAVAGQYSVAVTGSAGAVIPGQSTFLSNDDSTSPALLYILDNPYTLTGSNDFITLRALTSGTEAKLSAGDQLTTTAPIPLVDDIVTVDAIIIQAIDAEAIEDYRTKILESYRLEPQGGAATDYRLWAADAQGVKKVYPYAKSGASGEINLFVEANPEDSYDGDGTPTQSILDAVQAVVEFDPDDTQPLNDRGRRPLGIFLIHYLPVSVKQVNVNIAGGTFTSDQKTIISNAFSEFVSTVRPFVAAADILADRNDILNTNLLINTLLTALPGSIFTALTMTIDGVPTSAIQFTNGDIPFMNIVTYS